MLKKLGLVFVLALVLNWIWEVAHSFLYLDYQGGPITSFILFRSAVADAVMVLVLVWISQKIKRPSFVIIGGLILAVIIEIWALKTGRWTYSPLMPIIPFLGTGLTPTIQLAVIGYLCGLVFEKANN
jgi:hypothetical protein